MRRTRLVSLAALFLCLATLIGGCERERELPVLGSLPNFSLVDESGGDFSRAELQGRPWVASFVFTSCRTICPALTAHMVKLQRTIDERGLPVGLLSFSVDPKNDTPAVLKSYGERHGANFDNWHFLTGKIDEVNNVVVRGFKLALGEPVPSGDGHYDIMHSSHFVLVDAQGRIRGYYASTRADEVDQLLRDLSLKALRAEN